MFIQNSAYFTQKIISVSFGSQFIQSEVIALLWIEILMNDSEYFYRHSVLIGAV